MLWRGRQALLGGQQRQWPHECMRVAVRWRWEGVSFSISCSVLYLCILFAWLPAVCVCLYRKQTGQVRVATITKFVVVCSSSGSVRHVPNSLWWSISQLVIYESCVCLGIGMDASMPTLAKIHPV